MGLAGRGGRDYGTDQQTVASMDSLRKPVLTRRRILLAFIVAAVADALQLALGPLGWFLFDEIIDVIAMISIILLLGFHPLLLPTFVVELIPLVDMFPTWTGCVLAVVALKRKQEPPRPPPASPASDVIDV
jgi:hypothetical protein